MKLFLLHIYYLLKWMFELFKLYFSIDFTDILLIIKYIKINIFFYSNFNTLYYLFIIINIIYINYL